MPTIAALALASFLGTRTVGIGLALAMSCSPRKHLHKLVPTRHGLYSPEHGYNDEAIVRIVAQLLRSYSRDESRLAATTLNRHVPKSRDSVRSR